MGTIHFYYFIGRLNPPHAGHIAALLQLIDLAKENSDENDPKPLILLGSGPNGGQRTMNDPITFELKKKIIQTKLSEEGHTENKDYIIQQNTIVVDKVFKYIEDEFKKLKKLKELDEPTKIIVTHIAGNKGDDCTKFCSVYKSIKEKVEKAIPNVEVEIKVHPVEAIQSSVTVVDKTPIPCIVPVLDEKAAMVAAAAAAVCSIGMSSIERSGKETQTPVEATKKVDDVDNTDEAMSATAIRKAAYQCFLDNPGYQCFLDNPDYTNQQNCFSKKTKKFYGDLTCDVYNEIVEVVKPHNKDEDIEYIKYYIEHGKLQPNSTSKLQPSILKKNKKDKEGGKSIKKRSVKKKMNKTIKKSNNKRKTYKRKHYKKKNCISCRK
jgi:nicotinamide mononucleotide adenylyltransferase